MKFVWLQYNTKATITNYLRRLDRVVDGDGVQQREFINKQSIMPSTEPARHDWLYDE